MPISSVVCKIMETLSNEVNESTIWTKSIFNMEYNHSIYQFGNSFEKIDITKKIKQNNIGKFI